MDRRRSWQFANRSDQFLHDALAQLMLDYQRFEREQVANVEERRLWVRRLLAWQPRDARSWAVSTHRTACYPSG